LYNKLFFKQDLKNLNAKNYMQNHDNKPLSKIIGEKIRRAREDSHLSQKELGMILKVSDKAISSYEVGRTIPNVQLLKMIGEVVHRPISYFDDTPESEDIDLQIKIKTIEKELLEIKKLLQDRKK
jgi:transcriptional regulator with XRE-family HTH domain